ncbi:hypothetical protein QJQ45_016156, partial [Haematococcus lacustris]
SLSGHDSQQSHAGPAASSPPPSLPQQPQAADLTATLHVGPAPPSGSSSSSNGGEQQHQEQQQQQQQRQQQQQQQHHQVQQQQHHQVQQQRQEQQRPGAGSQLQHLEHSQGWVPQPHHQRMSHQPLSPSKAAARQGQGHCVPAGSGPGPGEGEEAAAATEVQVALHTAATAPQRLGTLGSLLCASAAGFCTSTVTFPLDVVRKRMQMVRAHPGTSLTYLQVWSLVYRQAGVRGFYAGIVPEYCKVLPGMAIAFATYEGIRAAFDVGS